MLLLNQKEFELSKRSNFLLWSPFLITPRKYKDESNKQCPETSCRISNQATKERTRKIRGIILFLFLFFQNHLLLDVPNSNILDYVYL